MRGQGRNGVLRERESACVCACASRVERERSARERELRGKQCAGNGDGSGAGSREFRGKNLQERRGQGTRTRRRETAGVLTTSVSTAAETPAGTVGIACQQKASSHLLARARACAARARWCASRNPPPTTTAPTQSIKSRSADGLPEVHAASGGGGRQEGAGEEKMELNLGFLGVVFHCGCGALEFEF